MLTRDEVVEKIRAHYDELQRFGVQSISVFGSVARGEAGPESDVDLLVDLRRGVTLFGFIDLRDYLQELLGVPVDLTTTDALREQIRDTVLAEAVRAA
jgi:predicted nucleotidyltransferase